MLNARLFGFWNGLTDALRTGSAQNETKGGGRPAFEALYADEARLEQFLSAMASLQTGSFAVLAQRFDFAKRKTVLDVGGANGQFSRILATQHAHLSLGGPARALGAGEVVPRAGEGKQGHPPAVAVGGEHRADPAAAVGVGAADDRVRADAVKHRDAGGLRQRPDGALERGDRVAHAADRTPRTGARQRLGGRLQ